MTNQECITIHANVKIPTAALEHIVLYAKEARQKDGTWIDPADLVSEMISRFLIRNDFENFVKKAENYK